MPYIKQERRIEFDKTGASGHHPKATSPGELNYELTLKATNYIDDNGLSYQSINDVIGALEAAKMEFYRRVVIPYEQKKIKENGDVY